MVIDDIQPGMCFSIRRRDGRSLAFAIVISNLHHTCTSHRIKPLSLDFKNKMSCISCAYNNVSFLFDGRVIQSVIKRHVKLEQYHIREL